MKKSIITIFFIFFFINYVAASSWMYGLGSTYNYNYNNSAINVSSYWLYILNGNITFNESHFNNTLTPNSTYAAGVNCADIVGTADDVCTDTSGGSPVGYQHSNSSFQLGNQTLFNPIGLQHENSSFKDGNQTLFNPIGLQHENSSFKIENQTGSPAPFLNENFTALYDIQAYWEIYNFSIQFAAAAVGYQHSNSSFQLGNQTLFNPIGLQHENSSFKIENQTEPIAITLGNWSNESGNYVNTTYLDAQGYIPNKTGKAQITVINMTSWQSPQGGALLTLSDDGSNVVLDTGVGGSNYFEIGTTGGFFNLYANPNPSNGYLLATISETQGAITEVNFYEGGTNHNRFWDSGSMRIGGPEGYLCSTYDSRGLVDCNTPLTGADLIVEGDVLIARKLFVANGSINMSIEGDINISGIYYQNGKKVNHSIDLSSYISDGSAYALTVDFLYGNNTKVNSTSPFGGDVTGTYDNLQLGSGSVGDTEVSALTWSELQSYPSTCSASQYISALGDTLTCASIGGLTNSQVSFTNQDLATSNSPTFVDLTLSGGDITGANGVGIDLGEENTDDITFIDSNSDDYVDIYCRDSGGNDLCEFKTGIFVSAGTFYTTNEMNARGGIKDDGAGAALVLNDEVRINENLTVEAVLFNYSTSTKIYVNASGCIITQSTNSKIAVCP